MILRKSLKYIYGIVPFKKSTYKVIKRLFKVPSKIYSHLYFEGVFNVNVEKEIFFKIQHYGYEVENEIFWSGIYGNWEKNSLKVWSILAKESNMIMDVGANTGVFSLLAKTLNKNATVFAFEPMVRVFNKLKKNIELNEFNIEPINYALSNKDGVAIVYDTDTEHTYSVTVNKNLNTTGLETFETEIHTKRLDSFIKEKSLKSIDLMKIDVETHEAEVLEGFGIYLREFRPNILIEVLNTEIANKLNVILTGMNYVFFEIDEIKGLIPKDMIKPHSSRNYLCLNDRSDPKLLDQLLY